MKIDSWLIYASNIIKSDSPKTDAQVLLCERLNKNKAYLYAFSDEILPNKILQVLEKDISKLATGYPLSYLLGKKYFWDMTLKVTPNTLIPRPDTETILETLQTIFKKEDKFSIVDLGTGSGAIAIAITRIFPNAKVWATDTCPQALTVAKQNAKNWAKSKITFLENNWLIGFQENQLDCIVSNPPYIEENDKHLTNLKYEPIIALTAKENGLSDIKAIITESEKHLKPNGYLLLEHGYNQARQVKEIFSKKLWHKPKTIKDLAGNDRVCLTKIKY